MRKFTPPPPTNEDDEPAFIHDRTGIPYLYFKRVGCIGVERSAVIGETVRICTGKGLSTSESAVHESYRGRTSSETFIMLNLGMSHNIPTENQRINIHDMRYDSYTSMQTAGNDLEWQRQPTRCSWKIRRRYCHDENDHGIQSNAMGSHQFN